MGPFVWSGWDRVKSAVYGCSRGIRGEVSATSGPSTAAVSANAASMRAFATSSWPYTHLAQTLRRTSTLCPAHSATWVGGTPALSQVDTAAWRRSYGRLASGEAYSASVKAAARAAVQTR